jgi:hypothetical protein
MSKQVRKINIGGVVKVKGKLYLVFNVTDSRIFCRLFRFTKTGRFQYYQDYNFPINICQLANLKERQIIYEERRQASIQRKPYSSISANYIHHLIR